MMFTFGSLFSGIGGIDLGLERAGMQCAWQVEIDEYASKVLQKHWPNVARFRDVRECGRDNLIGVDLIAGGFPCQPHSLAGERQASEDERNLWPEFYRIIRELKPRWVLGENVLGLLSSENGAFFGGILRDLAEAGYDAEWMCLRASDVGAPHQRERIFLVAYLPCIRGRAWRSESAGQQGTPNTYSNGASNVAHANRIGESRQESDLTSRECSEVESTSVCGWQDRAEMADASSQRCKEWHIATGNRDAGLFAGRASARPTPGLSQPGMGRVLDGIPARLDGCWPAGPDAEIQESWEPPRVILNRFLPNRTNRLKALGNAVVPQIAEYIGRCILESEAVS